MASIPVPYSTVQYTTTMRYTALLALATVPALALPVVEVPLNLPFYHTTLSIPNYFASGDKDICPDMKVSCVKDGKTVGDIGKKPFCRDGLTCGQCQ